MTTATLSRDLPRAGAIDASLGDDTLAALVGQFARHGDAFRLDAPLLGKDVLVLSHPDHVRHVLVDHHANFRKGIGIERVQILLGNGLMTSEGALWRAQRRAVQPAFHRTAVEARIADIVAVNRRLAARIGTPTPTPVDLVRLLSEATLEIVLRAIFGRSYERLVDGTNPFALLTDETDRDLKFAYALRNLGGILQQEIERRRACRDGNDDDDALQTLVDAKDRHSGEAMSDRQIRDEVFTLIVAGHETTASALSWAWYLVARHPEVAAALHAEIDGATDAEQEHPVAHRFAYAQQVIAESLRLYPPGWVLTRRALGPASIAGIDVVTGDDILISPFLVHRHPAFWHDSQTFDPDRFAPAAAAARSRFAYLPFGLGPRACIGEPLAMAEMLAHVVTLAHACDLRLSPPDQAVEWEARVNLRPRAGLRFTAAARHRA
ncbi:MAG: cytochrome P450 [Burkholderiales bacterium]